MITPTGVRGRATLAVAVAALLVSTSMALLTFQLTRSYLASQRDRLAVQQSYLNARMLQDAIPGTTAERLPDALSSLSREGGSQVLLLVDGRWLGSSVGPGEDDVPAELRRIVADGDSARQRVDIEGEPYVVVGVPLLEGRAAFFELFPLIELERTLQILALSLAGSAAVTTVAGALVGASLARRVLRPLEVTSQVAQRISNGELQLRLPPTSDREIRPIYESFNEMVDALATRIAREQRFAADVSHELRTPLTALVSSVAVLQRNQEGLPERAQLAVEILDGQIEHFRNLVLDLLDMARMESDVETAQIQPVDLRQLLERLLADRDDPRPRLEITGVRGPVLLDAARIERVVTNLLDNADAYAGGATAVTARGRRGTLTLTVDDAGPGIDHSERHAVFERLHRGNEARRSGHRGSGLGLALASEHLRLQGGTISVTDAPGGGARFVVELPLHEADQSSPAAGTVDDAIEPGSGTAPVEEHPELPVARTATDAA